MSTMRAAVVRRAGGPEVIGFEERSVPEPAPGEVLIRVKAFGLNRSELFTRQGRSPSVAFPRVLGIEAVGIVAKAPGGEFREGEAVATAMGGLGRQIDGGYAEFVLVPAAHVQRIDADLPWRILGALPEMLQTSWGSLFTALRLERGEHLLIRGGTTSVGLAAASLAKRHGAIVLATTRDPAHAAALEDGGVDEIVLDDGSIANRVRRLAPGGVDKVLELVGPATLADSLACARRRATVCMTGIVGGQGVLREFAPMDVIPTGVGLTVYAGEVEDFMRTPLGDLARLIAAGELKIHLGAVFPFDEIVDAHRCMEENRGGGKIVVVL